MSAKRRHLLFSFTNASILCKTVPHTIILCSYTYTCTCTIVKQFHLAIQDKPYPFIKLVVLGKHCIELSSSKSILLVVAITSQVLLLHVMTVFIHAYRTYMCTHTCTCTIIIYNCVHTYKYVSSVQILRTTTAQ